MDYRHVLLLSVLLWSTFPDAKACHNAATGWFDCCNNDCDSSEINSHIYNVEQKTRDVKSSTDRAISDLNDLKTNTQNGMSSLNSKVDSMKSDISGLLVGDRNEWKDMTTLKGRFESIESNIEDIKKEQVNIQKTLTTHFQSSEAELLYNQRLLHANLHQIEEIKNITSETLGVGRNNSRKLDGLKESSELINGHVLDNSNKLEEIEKVSRMTKEELKNITHETLGVGRNNSRKLDGLKESSELIKGNVLENSNKMGDIEKISKTTEEEVMTILRKIDKEKCPDMESKVWQTADVMAIVIPLLIAEAVLVGIIIFLLKIIFHPSEQNAQQQIEQNNMPHTSASSVSSASEIDSDCKNEPELGLVGVFQPIAEEHHTFGHTSRQDDWTYNPAYFTQRIVGLIGSKVSNIYESIRSIFSSRRPTIKHYIQNAKDATEVQGLLDSDTEERTENGNPAFDAGEEINSDYPLVMKTQITDYDTKEEKIQKSGETVPYNESVQGSCPRTDSCYLIGERLQESCSVSRSTEEETFEEKWEKVGGKDYDDMPSTSETPADDSNIRNDDSSHSFITPEKNLHTDKSVDEMNEMICSEGNSEHDCQSASQHWVPGESKDYSDTELKPAMCGADGNNDESDFYTEPTMSVPLVDLLLSDDENPAKETIPVNRKMSSNDSDNQSESLNDDENSDHFVASGNKTDDYPFMKTEPVNENTGEIEGRSNKQKEDRNQLWKSQIASEFNDEVQTNDQGTGASDFANFAEKRRADLENQWQLRNEIPTKGSEKFPDIDKPQDNDDVCITIEKENNEMQDNKTWNEPGPSFKSGPSFEQQPSVDSSKYDLSISDVPDTSEILKSKETLDKPDDKDNIKKIDLKLTKNADPGTSSVSVGNNNGTDNEAEEIYAVDNSPVSSDTHYEKLNKLDENPQYAELFPPNMQDILNELSDAAENILEFSRAQMERSVPDDCYTGDDYDDDISGYL